MEEGVQKVWSITEIYYGEFLVDQNDIILRHNENRYDHLRLHLAEEAGEMAIRLLFMSQNALNTVASNGIPEAYHDRPTKLTVDAYIADQTIRMEKELEG